MTAEPTRSPSLSWLDHLKGLALLWILLNHVAEGLFGFPHVSNPHPDWPTLAERIQQLRPLADLGPSGIGWNLLRWIGWSGDTGVQLFLVASGFGLAWGLLRRGGGTLSAREFYRRRLLRILPLWWGAHLLLFALSFLLGYGHVSPLDPAFWASFVGLRLTPDLFYYGTPAWWYVGLLLQLYLVFPLLWTLLRRAGPGKTLGLALAIAFAARALGLAFLESSLDAWLRGMVLVTRLPEFVLGMVAATWLAGDERALPRWRTPGRTLLWGLLLALGLGLGLFWWGNVVATALSGAGAFFLAMAMLSGAGSSKALLAPLGWVGRHSYSLYLVHHPIVQMGLDYRLPPGRPSFALLRLALVLLATVLLALFLESAVRRAQEAFGALGRRRGPGIGALAGVGAALTVLLLLLAAETAVRTVDPQEVLGWGERPSLEPDPELGWRLRPNQTTHLRWEGYDYVVRANALGFPGPDPEVEHAPGNLRLVVCGDAFTSAEGVDTDRAWPRVMEHRLRARGERIEVINLAVTGYGPNQYRAALRRHLPELRPDVVWIALFVNDFLDAQIEDEAFRADIGFGRPSPDAPRAFLRAPHLRKWIQLRLVEPFGRRLGNDRPGRGHYLANLAALERGSSAMNVRGRTILARRLEEIRALCEAHGARLALLLVPAPPQVVDPERLDYFPPRVDLTDSRRWDLDQPQRIARELALELDLPWLDLRDTLRADPEETLYFPFNMHWTRRAHERVAEAAARWLLESRES